MPHPNVASFATFRMGHLLDAGAKIWSNVPGDETDRDTDVLRARPLKFHQ